MTLACASGICSPLFASGELTQLEFLDFCAHELMSDGVVLDARHFPRNDGDYLAQIKKMAVDLGISVTALCDDDFLVRDDRAMEAAVEMALSIGAPLLVTVAASETAMSWSDQLERMNGATRIAKAANVTLALRNEPGTFAATAADLKRISKEADSAWLRYAVDPAGLDAARDAVALLARAVMLCAPLALDEAAIEEFTLTYGGFRGPLILDEALRDRSEMQNAARRWRVAFARLSLNRT